MKKLYITIGLTALWVTFVLDLLRESYDAIQIPNGITWWIVVQGQEQQQQQKRFLSKKKISIHIFILLKKIIFGYYLFILGDTLSTSFFDIFNFSKFG